MVARIRSGKSLKGAINYNEQKVKEGKAMLLMAKGYSKDIDQLKFGDKVNRLQKLADLNTRVVTHCMHVSLNFDVSEKLSIEKLQEIAGAYMNKIGFEKQPFLVYEHHDAAHQHVHIVATNIQKDGKRISLHNLGKVQSEKARKEIEISFGLVKASDNQKSLAILQPFKFEKATYGKAETKRAISNIVTAVVSQYRFASLPELNAVLKQYNIIADRGAENTRMFEKKGLQYSMLDNQGNKIGKPIKASSIYGKPILSQLESKYDTNKITRQPFKQDLKYKIDHILAKKPTTTESFADELKHNEVSVVYRRNEEGFLYGITYIDHTSKCVFNGSELGKEYSAAAIQKNLQSSPGQTKIFQSSPKYKSPEPQEASHLLSQQQSNTNANTLLNILIDPYKSHDYIPHQLKKKRRGKRKFGL